MSGQALVDMVGLPTLKCCVIEADYDLTNTAPTNLAARSGMFFSNALGTSSDPKLSYTAGADTSASLMQINF